MYIQTPFMVNRKNNIWHIWLFPFVTFLVSLLHMKPTCVFEVLGKTQIVE